MQVTFPLQLDLFDLCSEELVAALKGPRWAFKIAEDARVGIKADAAGPSKNAAAASDEAADMEQGDADIDHTGALTGRYVPSASLQCFSKVDRLQPRSNYLATR